LKVLQIEHVRMDRQQLFAILMVGMMVLSGVAYAATFI
jgi:hypothetical protein